MRRGTTPTHYFITGIDLTDLEGLFVTYEQNDIMILEKTIEDAEIKASEGVIAVKLSQKDTLKFSSKRYRITPFLTGLKENMVYIQVRLRFSDGMCLASNTIATTVDGLLKDGEI